jgi:23S rRNA (adenine1618-N6)-methyltransferase
MNTNISKFHPRNRHQGCYDLNKLIKSHPPLQVFIKKNKFQNLSIDFTNPLAVKTLNQALLKHYYNFIWDIPLKFLCPPIPSRADYIHYAADLLALNNHGIVPCGDKVTILDIGTGANCIYPLIGHAEYKWDFIASDINQDALKNAQHLIDINHLQSHIELRAQKSKDHIFQGVVKPGESIDLCICNPPFHASLSQAQSGTLRKWKNLKISTNVLNFGGTHDELWCEGGEVAFIKKMVQESPFYNIQWFTTLVSKQASLPSIYQALKEISCREVKTIDMEQGQKKTRLVAWRF